MLALGLTSFYHTRNRTSALLKPPLTISPSPSQTSIRNASSPKRGGSARRTSLPQSQRSGRGGRGGDEGYAGQEGDAGEEKGGVERSVCTLSYRFPFRSLW